MAITKQEAFSKNMREQVDAARLLIENDENISYVVAISIARKSGEDGNVIVQKAHSSSDETSIAQAEIVLQGLIREAARISAVIARAKEKK